ncbi:MAG: glycosyltransferase family 2 protein [Gammaproteobacteria bacterium]|nr:glycosyltransferase family 2 protein [Gammaproteobacteria bacterium]
MNAATPEISVVIPVYNESGNIRPLVEEIQAALSDLASYETVIVDDASTDDTGVELADLARKHDDVRVETHDDNLGQSAAICTGVKAARAPIIAVLDGDGQNDPADILTLYKELNLFDDVLMVVGERRQRRDHWIRLLSSRIANSVRSWLLKDGVRDTGCGLKVFYRNDFLDLPAFDHMHRFLPALIQRKGGEIRSVPVNHRRRQHGVSKYGINNRLWVGIVDLLGVMWLKRRRM